MLRSAAGRLWLPFTQMRGFDFDRRRFVRAEGNYLFDEHGRRLFDAVSSIWTIVHGHCHPKIVEAISRQARALDHSTLLGATNPIAEELAARLGDLLHLDYVFFASDGASAVEAALKMSLRFWQEAGEPQRTRFVRLTDAYHGDTAGAMSVSGIELFKSRFGAITFESRSYDADRSLLCDPDVAAVIVEPIVQAAAGMRIVPRERYLPLRGMAPLLIVDEIATGFGRTGVMFAHEALDLQPDIVCVGKGLTGGALALSATVARDRVYDAFAGAPADKRQFFHGHSYAGNPIACAAALACIALFEEEKTLAGVRSLAKAIGPALDRVRAQPAVTEVRQEGLMIGIELKERAPEVVDALYEGGHFTRPIGETIQLVPPLTSTQEELELFCDGLCHALS